MPQAASQQHLSSGSANHSPPPLTPPASPGSLPPPDEIQRLLETTHAKFAHLDEGENSPIYPALANVSRNLFGLALLSTSGNFYEVGDTSHPCAIMSVSKPFVFALVCELLGFEEVRQKVGVNATGQAFNHIPTPEQTPGGKTNPMVNAGAIATTSLAPGINSEDKWNFIHHGLSRFAGHPLLLDEDLVASVRATNFRNREIGQALQQLGAIYTDPAEAVELYTRQCCLLVTARDLATMAATLATGGLNPLTKDQVISPRTCHYTLAVMATAGLYDTSGDWLCDIGLPGKSGISGSLLAVSPGKGGFGSFSPPLDPVGNSVRGQVAAKFLSQQLGLDLFLSQPAG